MSTLQVQLCLFVRFFDGDCFREEIVVLTPLEGHTTGKIMFQGIVAFFQRQWT